MALASDPSPSPYAMSQTVTIEELHPGMFVHLDLGWWAHPFALSSFLITSAEQITAIRGLGLSSLRWIIDLMEEWGSAYGDRYIRSARNRMTMKKLRGNFEEHDRSLVLSGAAYDIFRAIYTYLRHRETEADAVIHAADHTSRLIFRAVDYCPPAGLDFQTFASAMLRADEVACPTFR